MFHPFVFFQAMEFESPPELILWYILLQYAHENDIFLDFLDDKQALFYVLFVFHPC